MTITELRNKRAKTWEAAKAFLDSHRNADGFLSAEDDATYTNMENEITALGNEISRLERLEAMDREMSMPTSAPLTEKPASAPKLDNKTGLSRQKLSHLMDSETWMNARRAIELGFADGMLGGDGLTDEAPAYEFSGKSAETSLINKITDKARSEKPPEPDTPEATTVPRGRSIDALMERLSLLKN